MITQHLRLKAGDRWLDGLYDNYDKALAAATPAAQELPVNALLTAWWVLSDEPDTPVTNWPTAGWIVKNRMFGEGHWIEGQSAQSIRQHIKQQAQEVSS